jgi:hypothetical protein
MSTLVHRLRRTTFLYEIRRNDVAGPRCFQPHLHVITCVDQGLKGGKRGRKGVDTYFQITVLNFFTSTVVDTRV